MITLETEDLLVFVDTMRAAVHSLVENRALLLVENLL